jgi:uncharacterized protein (TIGR02594 family)
MAFGKTKTLLLLCSVAFLATPALAKPVRQADAASVSKSQSQVEFTDMSARRRHQATRSRVHAKRGRHVRVHRERVERAVVSAPVVDIHGVGDRTSTSIGAIETAPRSSRRAAIASRSDAGMSAMGSSGVVAEARRYLGTNPTGHSALWCARFMNLVLERSGHSGSGSNFARSFASYGQRVSGPQVGAIAVMSRGRGGHVGVVSGIDSSGNPIIISGNHNRTVGESVYPRGRIYAYVMP